MQQISHFSADRSKLLLSCSMHNSTAKCSAFGVGSCSEVELQMSCGNIIDVFFCSPVKRGVLFKIGLNIVVPNTLVPFELPYYLMCEFHTFYLPFKYVCSLPSSAEVKNEWSCTPSPPVCLHGMNREYFTFTF